MNGDVSYQMSIENVPASYDPLRFYIVFLQVSDNRLPAVITLKSAAQEEGVQLNWEVKSDPYAPVKMTKYEVLQSADGIHFENLAETSARQDALLGHVQEQSWKDIDATAGWHFYKVRAWDEAGNMLLSNVSKVQVSGYAIGNFTVAPNPVKGRDILLSIENKPAGRYVIQLLDEAGTIMLTQNMVHAGGNARWSVKAGKLAAGAYRLQLVGPGLNNRQLIQVILEN
jgi:hypothetical protein